MNESNWDNLGILVTALGIVVTALVGILLWLGARKAAREARKDQGVANDAAQRSASVAEEENTIQTQRLQIEELRQRGAALAAKKAILRAEISKHWPGRTLVIRNSGPVHAREIEVLVNSVPINKYEEFMTQLPSDAQIAPDGAIELEFVLFRKDGKLNPPFRVSVSWSDDSDQRGTWESSLGH